jgi:uracil-DNA glycosylase
MEHGTPEPREGHTGEIRSRVRSVTEAGTEFSAVCGITAVGPTAPSTAGFTIASVSSPSERRELLKAVYEEARTCTRCPLHKTRTTVVFGAGNADAELMFIGEAPGANEDRQGLPFVGQAGKLLDKLLVEIGLDRQDVFIANTLKCRPPDNRDPHPNEIEACSEYLRRQVDLIEPTVICTLGNFATKLLRADTTGISRLHGQEEALTIGHRTVRLYPLYHPAAALYTPSTLEALRADFHRIPDLLALGPPPQPQADVEDVPEFESEPIDIEPIESEPIESEPIESEPIESEPIESEPIEGQPAAARTESEPVTSQLGLF